MEVKVVNQIEKAVIQFAQGADVLTPVNPAAPAKRINLVQLVGCDSGFQFCILALGRVDVDRIDSGMAEIDWDGLLYHGAPRKIRKYFILNFSALTSYNYMLQSGLNMRFNRDIDAMLKPISVAHFSAATYTCVRCENDPCRNLQAVGQLIFASRENWAVEMRFMCKHSSNVSYVFIERSVSRLNNLFKGFLQWNLGNA